MRLKRLLLMAVIVLVVVISTFEYSYAEDGRKVYVIVINKLTLPDLDRMPNIQRLIEEGSIGLMNTRGVSTHNGAESFVTINSSAKTYANSSSSRFYNLRGEFLKIYRNRTGDLYENYAIGNIGIGGLYNQNENNKYTPYIGALGDSLHDAGHITAVFGNADTEEDIGRNSALIAMDSRGLIDHGNIDNILLEDIDYPYGFRTNYSRILMEMEGINPYPSLTVIETGDLNRLYDYKAHISAEHFDIKRNIILEDIDDFIATLVENIKKEKSLLMVLSPNAEEKGRLSPIILWGKSVEKGTIISSTTNREGVVSNLDIAPTIADFLNTSNINMLGNVVGSVQRDEALNYIKSIDGRINIVSDIRTRVLLVYALMSIGVSLIISSIFWLKLKLEDRMERLFKALLLILYGIPLIFILNSLFINDNMYKFMLSSVIVLFIYSILVIKYGGKRVMTFISSLSFIAILLDLLLNGLITRFSVFSHDPAIGARYFGIGNELMGVFLATTTLCTGMLYKKYYNRIIPILFLGISVILVAHPRFGANVGGTIAILSATIYFILEMVEKRLSFKYGIISILIVLVAIGIMGYVDIRLNPSPTHLGSSLILLRERGSIIIKNIVHRKLSMNLALLRTSIWSKVLLISIFSQVAAVCRRRDSINGLLDGRMGKGILSSIVGCIIGFLFNDSGVMLAAIAMNLLTIFILFQTLDAEGAHGQ